ncbi:MAG: hypothetical protein JWR09_2456 [Mucilaginibacter sp.]|nr:hypothetical protein [Mucilaginibacter sp.]
MARGNFNKINDNISVITQRKSPGKTSDFLKAFLVELFPIEQVENLSEEENDLGWGHDELIIYINPEWRIPYKHLKIKIERRINLLGDQDEYQVWVELDFDKIERLGSFYKTSDFFSEKDEWLDAINNNDQFKKIKDSEPTKITTGDNFDCLG